MTQANDTEGLTRARRFKAIALLGKHAALAGAIALPLSTVALWLSPVWIETSLVPQLGLPAGASTLTFKAQAMGLLISLVPVLVCAYGLLLGRALFAAFGNGELLSDINASRLFRISAVVLALAVAAPMIRTALSVVLTLDGGAGQRHLVLSLSSNDYLLLIVGLLFLGVSWVMREANRIVDDHSKII